MKKGLLFALILIGATAQAQSSDVITTKAIAISDDGTLTEVKSDLPSEMIPSRVIIQTNGQIKTVDGIFIGFAAPFYAQTAPGPGLPWISSKDSGDDADF